MQTRKFRYTALAFALVLLVGIGILTQTAGAKDKATTNDPSKEIISKDYKDWRMVCDKGETQCRIFQQLSLEQDNKSQVLLIASLGVVKDKDGKWFSDMRMTTPLGVILPLGLIFRIDEGEQSSSPFQICSPEGCISEFVISEKGLKDMKAGTTMTVAYQVFGMPEAVTVGLSLKGFTKAHKEMSKRVQKNN